MIPENSEQEQERLEQREYKSSEDIFNQEEHISLDGNGKPIFNEKNDDDKLDKGLDIPEWKMMMKWKKSGVKMKKITTGV
jgi:hypothetical protein